MNLTIVKINSKLFLKVAEPILSKIVIITIIAKTYQISIIIIHCIKYHKHTNHN